MERIQQGRGNARDLLQLHHLALADVAVAAAAAAARLLAGSVRIVLEECAADAHQRTEVLMRSLR